MLNLTILSLSTSHLYSASPLFTGHNTLVKQSSFKYYFPTIFYNPYNFQIENSFFAHGFGSLIHLEREYNVQLAEFPSPTPIPTFTPPIRNHYGEEHTGSNLTIFYYPTPRCICRIIDCHFINIIMQNKDSKSFINLYHDDDRYDEFSTFYMTSCVFNSCTSYYDSFIKIGSRATTISHICCSNMIKCLDGTSDDYKKKTIFLYDKVAKGSFLKFYFSTIFGNNENSDALCAIYITGNAAIRYQCVNVSKFKINYIENDGLSYRNIVNIEASACLNMLMNTFYDLYAQYVFRFNPQNGDVGYNHYLGFTNFDSTEFKDFCIYTSMNSGTYFNISDCIFRNLGNSKIIKNTDSKSYIYIANCIFEQYVDTYECVNANFYNTSIISNPQTHNNFFFITENLCRGESFDHAYGCQNDTCPDNIGCAPGKFEFTFGDIPYTPKRHDDIDTPTPSPSIVFTESSDFSQSLDFTLSSRFNPSHQFSNSDSFSHSFYFTETDKYTRTTGFTNSYQFSKSEVFSESKRFSKSDNFHSTFFFTSSAKFSETVDFTKSSLFSMTSNFTKSDIFTPSFDFNATHTFTPSRVFESSNLFSFSDYFSKSSYFSSSNYFSKSGTFHPSDPFIKSGTFSPSNSYTKSNTFSPSNSYTKSNTFSPSNSYTKSNTFSPSNSFTRSDSFTKSNSFSASQTLNPRRDVVISIKEEKSSNKYKIIGGAVGAVAGVIAIVVSLVAFLVIRHKRLHQSSGMFEELETIDDPMTNSVTYKNALQNFEMSDDPFAEDFVDH